MTRILLSGGQVSDGSGAAAFASDVLVENERILEVRPNIPHGDADTVIDASDRVVAPGFIDLHTHFDAQVFWDPMLSSSCFHGVTSVIGGNCGFSLAPYSAEHRPIVLRMLRDLEDMPTETLDLKVPPSADSFTGYLKAVEETGPMLNFGSFIGHSTVRIAAMGEAAYARNATAAELDRMKALVKEALDVGAMGFATKTIPGTRPAPSQYASHEETLALLRILGAHGRGVAMFNAGGEFDLEQVYKYQPEIGVPFTWIALLTHGSGSHQQRVADHLAWRAKGSDVYPQVTCRPLVAQCTMRMPSVFRSEPLTAINGLSDTERLAHYRDAQWRDKARPDLQAIDRQPVRWDEVTILASPSSPAAVGRTIAQVAGERGLSSFDTLFDMAIDDNLATRIIVTYANSDEAEVAKLLNVEGAVLGLSDAGAHPSQSCDSILPTDLLGKWVRDRKVMPLEQAVRKLTREPAQLLGLKDRGLVAKGYFADIVVFDPKQIGPGEIRIVDDLPGNQSRLLADRPTGMHHILINGAVTRLDEQSRYAKSGKILRPQ